MSFSILHGGYVRKSDTISSSDSTAWTAGRLLSLNSSAQLVVHPGTNANRIVGVAGENRVSTGVGPTTTLTVVGAPTGNRASYILDETVINMEQNLESGVTFAAGNQLFVSTNGKVTTSGNGTGSTSPVIGVALSDGASGDANRALTWFFSVTY